MVIIYEKTSPNVEECHLHLWIAGISALVEDAGKLYMEGFADPVCNDAINFSWLAVPEQAIVIPGQYLDEMGAMVEPPTIGELNLILFTLDTLPHSEHIAKLKAVDPAAVKPATVTRKFMGELYDVACFVTETVKDQYQAGDIAVGDYVVVSFISEYPDGEERNIPIVTGKVFRSW